MVTVQKESKEIKPQPASPDLTLADFEDESFTSATSILMDFNQILSRAEYTESKICSLLKINSLQEIEPTYMTYYDKYLLPQSDLADLIRIFLLRSSLSEHRLRELLGDKVFSTLTELGILIRRGEAWASRVDIFCADGLYLATDHRFMFLPEDRIGESPVMYIGMDSMGLVHTAPRYRAEQLLDLCCGSGIQGLVASRYARHVTGVDINPRSIRFSRFNAQLNGIRNIRFYLGDLYEPVKGRKFDTILANPPFVPSPKSEYRFRDGGKSGEEILRRIIRESADHLAPEGRLFIVTDLVDVHNYEAKLNNWWTDGPAHKLVLQTADRNDILFSEPHSHRPFGQSFEEYVAELEQWIRNFHEVGISSVNFGYVMICRLLPGKRGSYYNRTIHNPSTPIHQQVKEYFRQRELLENPQANGDKFLVLSRDIYFRTEVNHDISSRKIELFAPNNPYYTTYRITDAVYRMLQDIDTIQPRLSEFLTPVNQKWVYDLIYKGILTLRDERIVNDNFRPKAVANTDMAILELQSKTTPTCLSSYLVAG